MIKCIASLFLIVSFASCIDVSKEVEVKEDVKVESFTKVYVGTIDNERVVVELTSDKGQITGKYFCRSGGADLILSGTLDTLGNIELVENNPGFEVVASISAVAKDHKIAGTWTDMDSFTEVEVKLSESNLVYLDEQAKVIKENVEFSPIIAGAYHFRNGGNTSKLIILKLNGRDMYFQLTVSSSYCMDDVEGEVKIAADGSGEIDFEDCRFLRFQFEEDLLRITEDGPCAYHGPACAFEGEFLRRP